MTNNNDNLLPSGCAESQRFRASRRSVLLGASGVMGGLVTTTVVLALALLHLGRLEQQPGHGALVLGLERL